MENPLRQVIGWRSQDLQEDPQAKKVSLPRLQNIMMVTKETLH
jgi:hypothetical protein